MAKMKAWKKEVVLFYAFYQVLVVLSEPLSNLKLAVIVSTMLHIFTEYLCRLMCQILGRS